MVPPRVAQKMSIVSVESMAFLAPGPKAAERAHRPGSRRPGGVEATGASLGTVPSWPRAWVLGEGPTLEAQNVETTGAT